MFWKVRSCNDMWMFNDLCEIPIDTIFASNGMSGDFYSTDGMDLVIQNSVLDVQLSLEDSLEKVLKVSTIECDFVSQLKSEFFLDIFSTNSH